MNEKTLKILEFNAIKHMLKKHIQSSLGLEHVNSLYPIVDGGKIKILQDETFEGYSSIIKYGSPPFGGFVDVNASLKRARIEAVLSPGELLNIAQIYRITSKFKKYLSEIKEKDKLQLINGMIEQLVTNRPFEDQINNCIISEEEIADDASAALKNIRKQIFDVNASIKSKLNSIVNSLKFQKYLQDNIITMRDGRYVVPVKQEYRGNIPGIVHDSSSTGATLFVEPMAVVEANNKLRELYVSEKTEIENILKSLSVLVYQNIEEIESNTWILGKLDFIFAKGKLALELDCTRPIINTDGYINLIKARHPLIEKSKVVPIDVKLSKDVNTLVITGPNTGGKTVTLKTVGLFVIMAECGLHIPAKEDSEISIFSKVFADIGDEQSIEQNLSTFSSHMTNIVSIIENADQNCLCLFDELGAGTDPTEGAALAMAILTSLFDRGTRTIATTHYSEIKMFALSNKGFQNASCEFDIETLRPTYRVLMGIPGKSNAFEISKRIGLPAEIIQNARELISKEDIRFEDVISNLHKERETAIDESNKAKNYRYEIENLKNEIENEKRKLQSEKQNIILKARQEALNIIENAKLESEEILEEMKIAIKIEEQQEREKLIIESKSKLKLNSQKHQKEITKSAIGRDDNAKPPKTVEIGQKVYLVNIDQSGIVLSKPDRNENVSVQVGIMKINANINNLRITSESKEKSKQVYNKFSNSKSYSISSEIDVRGEYLDDALIKIDKYLDDAYLSGLNMLTIIHGKGTGVLKNGIHKFLKGHPHIRTFRQGIYGEGDAGVTIVELK